MADKEPWARPGKPILHSSEICAFTLFLERGALGWLGRPWGFSWQGEVSRRPGEAPSSPAWTKSSGRGQESKFHFASKFVNLCCCWGVDSPGLAQVWAGLGLPGLAWACLNSLRLAWARPRWPGCAGLGWPGLACWPGLGLPGLRWDGLASTGSGLAWPSLAWLGF